MSAVPHVVLSDFLSKDQHANVLTSALSRKDAFWESRTGSVQKGDNQVYEELRKSRSASLEPHVAKIMQERIADQVPAMLAALGMREFPYKLELEMTAYSDGSKFLRHVDNAGVKVPRILTCVYYFYEEPKRFEGGSLILYGLRAGEPLTFEPHQNTLIAFPSFWPHAVSMVQSKNPSFNASRFAINIWLHTEIT